MRYGIPAYTVIGGFLDGNVYHVECLDINDASYADPIFADGDDDGLVCDECHTPLRDR